MLCYYLFCIDKNVFYNYLTISSSLKSAKEFMEASNKGRKTVMEYKAYIAANPKIKERKITHD